MVTPSPASTPTFLGVAFYAYLIKSLCMKKPCAYEQAFTVIISILQSFYFMFPDLAGSKSASISYIIQYNLLLFLKYLFILTEKNEL